MKYPDREEVYKWKMCECGHYTFNHMTQYDGINAMLRYLRGKEYELMECEKCLCPKYKYMKTELYIRKGETRYTDYVIDEDEL